MLFLEDSAPIGRGTARVCYHFPDNPELVIKVPFENDKEGMLANIKEMKGYHDLMRNQIDLNGINHCYGLVSTNRGVGLVCDCVRNDDGLVAKTIWEILLYQESCDVQLIRIIAKQFCNYLQERDIFLFDINLKNIMLKVLQDGSYEPVAIDLKGRFENHEFIPYASYIKYFARKKMKRRVKQLLERIDEYYTRRAELRVVDKKVMRGELWK
jgi:hypothetical protein